MSCIEELSVFKALICAAAGGASSLHTGPSSLLLVSDARLPPPGGSGLFRGTSECQWLV